MVSLRCIGFFMTTLVLSFLLLLLPALAVSAREPTMLVSSQRSNQQDVQKTTKHLQQMKAHGLILWASMGFIMPIGLLLIRQSTRVQCGKSLKMLFYSHVILQTAAFLLAIAGALLAVKDFENAFNNAHQRVGLALFALMLLQPLIGFCRPHRKGRGRSIWYFVHWLIGTGLCVMAIVEVYLGLHAYHVKTLKNTRIWIICFTAEVSTFAFVYLLQDRWDHMLKQGTVLGQEQITPADHLTTPPKSP